VSEDRAFRALDRADRQSGHDDIGTAVEIQVTNRGAYSIGAPIEAMTRSFVGGKRAGSRPPRYRLSASIAPSPSMSAIAGRVDAWLLIAAGHPSCTGAHHPTADGIGRQSLALGRHFHRAGVRPAQGDLDASVHGNAGSFRTSAQRSAPS